MKKSLLFTLFLVALFVQAQQGPKPITVVEYKLENGLTVMLTENHESASVFGIVTVKAGGKNDPKDATGIAHYLEHMLFKGTQEMGTIDYEKEKVHLDKITALYNQLAKTTDEEERKAIQQAINKESIAAGDYAIANEIDKLLAEIGGTGVNAFTTEDYTAYMNAFPPNQIEKWLEIYSHRFENPVFRLFQSELEAVYEEKNISMDDGFGLLFEELLSNVYKEHPYGQQTILGSVEHLKNPSLEKMYAFYNTYYVANNMALILSGDFNIEEIKPMIEAKFGKWRSGVVPEFPKYEEAPFTKGEKMEAKATPIKIGAMTFRSPPNGHPDKLKYDIALKLLSNQEATGMLDKLMDEGEILGSGIEQMAYNDYGASIVFFVPKLVGQSLETAEEIVKNRMQKLLDGDFSEDDFNTIKLNNQKEIELKWESNYSRVYEMVDAFTQQKTWDEHYNNLSKFEGVTKQDVVEVANKYLGKDYFALYSRMGFPKKEKLEKPGFEPVVPKSEAKSAFAQHLETVPTLNAKAQYVDFEKDILTTTLSNRFTVNQVNNPFNEVFDLSIVYGKGSYNIRELDIVSSFLGLTGTDDKSVSELKEAFAALGASYYFYQSQEQFTMSIQGLEQNLEKTLVLVNEFMTKVKADEEKLKIVNDDLETERKIDREEGQYISTVLTRHVLYGPLAQEKQELSKKEFKALTAQQLVDTYKSLFKVETTVSFTGNTDPKEFNALCKKYLMVEDELSPKQEPVVLASYAPEKTEIYIIEDKKAVQSHISFVVKGELGDKSQMLVNSAFNEYFGGGMSSLVFQEIREFRSLAYSAYGNLSLPKVDGKNTSFYGYIGCQADKTIDAVDAMQSLLNDMPQKPERMDMIRQALLEKGKTAKPNFRSLAMIVDYWKQKGYTSDPNKLLVESVGDLRFDDIVAYYNQELKNRPIIITIVGDPGSIDMKKLKEIGPVTVVKKKNLFVN